MLQESSPSKHNAMLGIKIKHPESTRFDDDDDPLEKRPAKRLRLSPPDDEKEHSSPRRHKGQTSRIVPDSDAESDDEELGLATSNRKTDIESALPPIRTDKEAIQEYEATRAAQAAEELGPEGRLSERKWVRGKSSIYVDAFNLALETVLEDESHLFTEAELRIFEHWRNLSYEAQYL